MTSKGQDLDVNEEESASLKKKMAGFRRNR